ncbi:hypothetical protein [Paeniglutamicibacter cryotolerans]|uniref:Uncharacterized protein n=1 Tax=Paeniglutamicibacter cryotolerans TaxID=670079 RepID=A0A839QJ38_9MICC|nr:hypothetical protein [Paeniglutamicibacter cryotolerans]MBB2994555.1 hypothetical protein [Paeniglutamicibacter cryotolerans]
MEAEPFGSILSIVPRGFEMYARVFHPVERDRPRDTKTWRGVDESTCFNSVQDIEASLETERVAWAKAAASFNTTMHPEAQYARLVRRDYGNADGAISADGWRYGSTSEGNLDAASLAVASEVLARHTATPDAGIAAVWDGWGGLVSSAGVAHFGFEPSGGMPARYTDEDAAHPAGPSLPERLTSAARQGIAGARSMFEALPGLAPREPEPGSGLLAREVSAGPRFDLHGGTGRNYILFEAGANGFADVRWPDQVPWVDDSMWAQSPSILWPEDHAWVLATEIDFDSTLVAGTAALIHELMRTPGLEVLPIRTGADLTCDGDVLNRPQ